MTPPLRFLFTIILCTSSVLLSAQEGYKQSFDPNWVKTFAAYGFSWAFDMDLDAQGNIYATGYYQSTIAIDTGTIKQAKLSLRGSSNDIYFLCKFTADGKFCWIQRGLDQMRPCKVKLDAAGNIQVVGTCYGNQPRLISASNDTLIMSKRMDYRNKIFLAKYNPDGKLLQAKLLPSSRKQSANDFDFDDKGNIYIAGTYEFRSKDNPSLVQNSYLVLKVDRDYNVVQQMQGDTTGKSHLFSIYYNSKYGLLIGGSYEKAVIIGGKYFYTPNNEGYRFFAKFDTTLQYQFAEGRIGRIAQGACIATKFNSQGEMIVLCSSSYGIMTINKYYASGRLNWSLDTKGNRSAYPEKLIIDEQDNIYICGNSYGVLFNSTWGTVAQAEDAGYAPFMVKYASSGRLLWLKTIGGDGTRYCKSMAIKDHKIYGFGWTNSPLEFATQIIPITSAYTFWIGEFDLDAFNRYEIPQTEKRQ